MNEQFFYPGGRGNIVRDPSDLPRFAPESNILLEVGGGAIYYSSTGNFWSWVDKAGAVADVTVANTWTPIVDIVGKGFLGNVIASHGNTNGVKTIGIRVEYDGIVWDWVQNFGSFFDYSTLVLGALSPGEGTFPVGDRQMETADAVAGIFAAGFAGRLVPVTALMSNGSPVLEFKQSLKVSVKNSAIDAGSSGRKAGCTFVLR